MARSITFLLYKHDEYLGLDPSAHGKAGYPLRIYNPALGGSGKRQTESLELSGQPGQVDELKVQSEALSQ